MSIMCLELLLEPLGKVKILGRKEVCMSQCLVHVSIRAYFMSIGPIPNTRIGIKEIPKATIGNPQ